MVMAQNHAITTAPNLHPNPFVNSGVSDTRPSETKPPVETNTPPVEEDWQQLLRADPEPEPVLEVKLMTPRYDGRARARRIDPDEVARRVGTDAVVYHKWLAACRHGGTVPTSYAYPAQTECVVAVSDPYGRVVVWTAWIRAHEATLGGAANACLKGCRAIWDARCGAARRREAWRVLREGWASAFPEMAREEKTLLDRLEMDLL